MAHVKAGGTAKNLRDSKPKMLGVKIYGDQFAKAGSIIVRQRGQQFRTGLNTSMGKDHTIFSKIEGKVHFAIKRVNRANGKSDRVKLVSVLPA
jgi:large subunit ribosomal protein L27